MYIFERLISWIFLDQMVAITDLMLSCRYGLGDVKQMLHMIKMAAGIRTVGELYERQAFMIASAKASGMGAIHMPVTRFRPKRADEILDGGSLFWVFNKRVQLRQKIVEFREVETSDGIKKCGIVLEPPLINVELLPRKAFQGWRYLTAEEAPQDFGSSPRFFDNIPVEMRMDLQELCLI